MAVDKHVDARMERIELAVQRLQLLVVLVIGLVAVIWCLGVAEAAYPEPDLTWLLISRGVAVALGLATAFAAAKLVGYPLQVLKRA